MLEKLDIEIIKLDSGFKIIKYGYPLEEIEITLLEMEELIQELKDKMI